MAAPLTDADYRDRSRTVVWIGGALLLAGATGAILAPLEWRTIRWFEPGGRFHYPGFGFGSVVYAVIVGQVIAYSGVAALFIPLGLGHLRRRQWIRPASLALLWGWFVIGGPAIVIGGFLLVAFKGLDAGTALGALALLVAWPCLPWLLIPFYAGHNLRRTLETADPRPDRFEDLPAPVLALAALQLAHVVALSMLVPLRGLFPVFGTFHSGPAGIVLCAATAAALAVTLAGTVRRRRWAQRMSVVLFGTLAASIIVTLVRAGWPGTLAALELPADALQHSLG